MQIISSILSDNRQFSHHILPFNLSNKEHCILWIYISKLIIKVTEAQTLIQIGLMLNSVSKKRFQSCLSKYPDYFKITFTANSLLNYNIIVLTIDKIIRRL